MKKNGKYCSGKKSMNMKPLAVLLALTLLVGCAVGGTLAWLTAKTSNVQNTFSASDITIELKEHEYNSETDQLTGVETSTGVTNYKMVPGWTIPKDPWATVIAGSEDCYLFVKVTKSANFDTYMTWEIADGWTKLFAPAGVNASYEEVYYKIFDSKSTDANKPVKGEAQKILKNDKVTVRDTVTKELMAAVDGKDDNGNAINTEVKPSLSFTAYAVQLYKSNAAQFNVTEAWDLAKELPAQG